MLAGAKLTHEEVRTLVNVRCSADGRAVLAGTNTWYGPHYILLSGADNNRNLLAGAYHNQACTLENLSMGGRLRHGIEVCQQVLSVPGRAFKCQFWPLTCSMSSNARQHQPEPLAGT